MRAVNLLPRDESLDGRLQGRNIPALAAVAGVAIVSLGSVALFLSASGAAGESRTDLALVEASISSLPKTQQPAVSLGALTQERESRTSALAAAIGSRVAFDRLLREISLVLPGNAWLTGLQASSPVAFSTTPAGSSRAAPATAAASSGARGVTISGATYSQEGVGRVLARLAVIPSLQDVRLTTSALVDPAGAGDPRAAVGRRFVTFTITAALRAGAAS